MKSSITLIHTAEGGEIPVLVRADGVVIVPSVVRGRRVRLDAVRDAIRCYRYPTRGVSRWVIRTLWRGAKVRYA